MQIVFFELALGPQNWSDQHNSLNLTVLRLDRFDRFAKPRRLKRAILVSLCPIAGTSPSIRN